MDIKKDFIQRLRGRAEFCRDRGEVKTPELLEQAAQLLEEKAQAVPEGFVLVSKEIPDSVVDRLRYSSYHWGDGTRDYFTPVYQMIIEAQEPAND
ncbi:hypothetical protein HLH12_09400 [Acinetobacter sp. NIPH 2377]|uniref:hypothetical protein n=1 Tax=Acinetobacter terrestris TaxID=2529843 RepID=UPI00149056FB|nr:hypothetical protein [Acinetobacter terrestris]NNH35759.1 hypothetical protein [Acinetobacter terrestris]